MNDHIVKICPACYRFPTPSPCNHCGFPETVATTMEGAEHVVGSGGKSSVIPSAIANRADRWRKRGKVTR